MRERDGAVPQGGGLRRATLSYLVALGLIAGLSIGTHVLVDSIVRQQETTARIVNVAGRQRMLSQRIAGLAAELAAEEDSLARSALRADLDDAIDLMARSHRALRRGDADWGIPASESAAVRRVYDAPPVLLESRVSAYVGQARAFSRAAAEGSIDEVALRELRVAARDRLLAGLDLAVRTYEADSERAIRNLRHVLFGVLGLMLATLAAEAALIFRPLFRRLADRERRLVELAADLDQALTLSTAELRLAADIIETTDEAVVVLRRDGTILSVNPAFCRITGLSRDEARGRPISLLFSDRQDPAFYDALWTEFGEAGRWSGELWLKGTAGDGFFAYLTINALAEDLTDTGASSVGVFSDATELRRKDETIAHMAMHDPLTGLPNRDLLWDRLGQLMQRARLGGRYAVVSIDLDRFKAVNDSLGQPFGDVVLRQAAGRLVIQAGEADTVARIGADEFVVLMEGRETDADYAVRAGHMVEALSAPYAVAGREVRLGASAGVAMCPGEAATAADLLRQADAARRRAKGEGGGVQFHEAGMDATVQDRLRMETALRAAAEAGDFSLVYQPKVGLADNAVDGAEALIRWTGRAFGAVSPATFIPLAEEIGVIGAIGEWVLRQACAEALRFREAGFAMPLAVNVSAQQLRTGALVPLIADMLERSGLPPALLQLELTESSLIADYENTVAQLAALRDLGVVTALDDFGTGYSSLSYLRRLPIDFLKIDRAFVMNLEADAADVTVVGGIIAMAHALGLKVIAEGIETKVQAQILAGMGCDVGQGYLFSKPVPPQRLRTWMAARKR